MPKQAAGSSCIAGPVGLEVLLAHPGGPLWARKDLGAWTLPKGQFTDGELPLDAAKREFEEEMGSPPSGDFRRSARSSSRAARSFTPGPPNRTSMPRRVKSNLFSMEWPPKSGQMARVS